MSIRAAYVHAPWRFEIRHVELPPPAPGQVLIDVTACGICGTDVHWADQRATTAQPFGHEVAGTVAEVGDNVTAVKPGDQVTLETSSFCGQCETCRNGRVDLCTRAPSFWRLDGSMGFSERMLAPIECVVPANGLAPEAAALAEPLGVAQDLVLTSGATWNEDVLVVGPGPIGLMAVSLLRQMGVRRLSVAARRPDSARAKLALELGADEIVTDPPPATFQRILNTAPPSTVAPYMASAAYGGTVTFIGLDHGPGATITIDADAFHFNKLQLRASHASPALWLPRAIDLMRRGAIPWERLVTHQIELLRIEDAVRIAATDRDTAIKVVVRP